MMICRNYQLNRFVAYFGFLIITVILGGCGSSYDFYKVLKMRLINFIVLTLSLFFAVAVNANNKSDIKFTEDFGALKVVDNAEYKEKLNKFFHDYYQDVFNENVINLKKYYDFSVFNKNISKNLLGKKIF